MSEIDKPIEQTCTQKDDAKEKIVDLMQHQFDGEKMRKEALRSKSYHHMTTSALLIGASIALFSFCVPITAEMHSIFLILLYILWLTLIITLIFSLFINNKATDEVQVSHWETKNLAIMWNDKKESAQRTIFEHFSKMIDDLRTQNNKIQQHNKTTRIVLKTSTILFTIFFSFVAIIILHKYIIKI